MTKYRIVPIVRDGFSEWKIQTIPDKAIFPFWRDVLRYDNEPEVFSTFQGAEHFVLDRIERERKLSEHLKQPIKEYGN